MEQQYTLYKGDNGIWVMLTAGGQPVVGGSIQDVTAHLTRAHLLKSPVTPGGVMLVNRQEPVDPVVPRPHPVSGAAG